MRILLIEDEAKTRQSLQQGLEEENWMVDIATDGETGLEKAINGQYEVIVSDIMMPGMNGLQICQQLRDRGIRTPVLMLSALGETDDKVLGLESGADDYLTKPFEFREFMARVKALNRRQQIRAEFGTKIKIHDLELDTSAKTVRRDGKSINLTPREFALLEFLMRHPGKVLSKTEIAEKVWDLDFDTGTNVIEVYVNYLRNKVDKGFPQKLIHTQFGLGYVFRQPEETP
ncbi:MAG: response regulator transcription factor [Lewinellaceae bacterium]|nr:response regulator transcription factor [Lewinellaceae bacterium]